MIILALLLSASPSGLANALRGFDNSLTPQVMATISADPVADLIAVADDTAQPLFVRARAIALFGRYTDARTSPALVRLSTHEAPELRVKAVKGLKWLTEKHAVVGANIRAALSERLADDNRFVRMQAVRALAASGSRAELEQRRSIETDAGVRRTLDEVLR